MDDYSIGHKLQDFDFSTLFIDNLGWDRHRGSWPIRVIEPGQRNLGPGLQHGHAPRLNTASIFRDDLVQQTFTVQAVAQKQGVQILHCKSAADGKIPNYPTRCRIQHQVAKLAHENVVIFTNRDQTHQIWQWVRRVTGELPQYCEHHFRKTFLEAGEEDAQEESDAEPLDERLRHLFFSITDEENITLTEVVHRLRRAFYNFRNGSRRGPYSRVRLYEYDIATMNPSVQFWVEQVYAEQRLSRAEEIGLARAIVKGNKLAREKFIRANLYVVAEIAWRLTVDNDLTDDEFLDLVQRGNILLVRLVDRFDPTHGARFQSFASLLIASRLSAAASASARICYLPRYQEERLPQILRLWDEVEDTTFQHLERQPTDIEIAAGVATRMSLSPKVILQLRQVIMPASSWEIEREEWEALEDDEEAKYALLLKTEPTSLFFNHSSLEIAVNLVRREQLDAVLEKLSQRERDVIRMRFGLDDGNVHTLEEVGERFAITRERVRQIELRALKKLRRMGPVSVATESEVAAALPPETIQVEDTSSETEASFDSDADCAI